MFQGNDVKDEYYDYALFAELGSSPATMQAGKFADAIGLLPGNEVQISDAEAAYTQLNSKAPIHGSNFPKNSGQTGGTNYHTMIRSVLSFMPCMAILTLVAIGNNTVIITSSRSVSSLYLILDGLHATGTLGCVASSLSM